MLKPFADLGLNLKQHLTVLYSVQYIYDKRLQYTFLVTLSLYI